MARGDKNYDKEVRKVNNGAKAKKKKEAVHKMVEALIRGDSEEAAEHLHYYLQETTRSLILGEAKDEEKEDEKDEDESDDDEDEDEDEKDDEKDEDESDDDEDDDESDDDEDEDEDKDKKDKKKD